MARATLSFDLPEEAKDFECACKGRDAHFVLWEMDNYLRKRLKYEELDHAVAYAIEQARRELWRLIDEKAIELDA